VIGQTCVISCQQSDVSVNGLRTVQDAIRQSGGILLIEIGHVTLNASARHCERLQAEKQTKEKESKYKKKEEEQKARKQEEDR